MFSADPLQAVNGEGYKNRAAKTSHSVHWNWLKGELILRMKLAYSFPWQVPAMMVNPFLPLAKSASLACSANRDKEMQAILRLTISNLPSWMNQMTGRRSRKNCQVVVGFFSHERWHYQVRAWNTEGQCRKSVISGVRCFVAFPLKTPGAFRSILRSHKKCFLKGCSLKNKLVEGTAACKN